VVASLSRKTFGGFDSRCGGVNTNSNGVLTYTSNYGTITKFTQIVREFDEDGNLVKETETITEYDKGYQPVPYSPYPGYPNPYIYSTVRATN